VSRTRLPAASGGSPLRAGSPLVDQIITSHLSDPPDGSTLAAGGSSVAVGQLVTVRPDHVYVQDGNAPTIAKLYAEHGFDSVFDPARVSFVFDHSVLVADVEMADRMKEADAFASRLGVDVQSRGRGISHVIAAELGWFTAGSLVLGSDSHTCVGGAFGSLGLGMGASDITAAMVTGTTWLRVPETVTVELTGAPHRSVRPRDVLLTMLNRLGQEPFLYRSVEFAGDWARALSSDSAASLASLGVELGAKCVFIADADGLVPAGTAPQAQRITFDLESVEPVVSVPHLPANTRPLSEVAGTRIDYVFLGSCTNSRLEDLAEAAQAMVGHRVREGVQFVVTPGSIGVYRDAVRSGYVETLMEAGAVVTPPGCGSCVGTQGPLPARGDNVLSTMNRNFRGRMGNPAANIYLASPTVAAMASVLGAIPAPQELP
jgi:3-isopropylmalate/(R)-2-methylmalate dehydratase large subunit